MIVVTSIAVVGVGAETGAAAVAVVFGPESVDRYSSKLSIIRQVQIDTVSCVLVIYKITITQCFQLPNTLLENSHDP